MAGAAGRNTAGYAAYEREGIGRNAVLLVVFAGSMLGLVLADDVFCGSDRLRSAHSAHSAHSARAALACSGCVASSARVHSVTMPAASKANSQCGTWP